MNAVLVRACLVLHAWKHQSRIWIVSAGVSA